MIINISASKLILICVVIIISVIGCGSETNSKEVIIAKVSDKSISLNEFLRRAEYTIRPSYCRNNSNIEKQIILNSLIAEKLFSIEAEKNGFVLDHNKDLKLYMQGRKEQAMRQILYNKEVAEKVKIDSSSINKYIKFANRVYDLSYISITDETVLSQLDEELNVHKLDFEKLLTESYNLKDIPQREVVFNNNENQVIVNTLFTTDRKKGEVIGPIQVDNERQMFLKINGWTDTPVITNTQIIEKQKKVKEFLELREGKRIYKTMIQNIMKNKNIDFNKEVFFKFTDIVAPIYLKSNKEKEELYLLGIWGDSIEKEKYLNTFEDLNDLKDKVIFHIDDKNWTVGRLMDELKKHPFTFRKSSIPNKEFGFQLQLAIIDLVRDKYLTEVAYKKNIDTNPNIIRNTEMWEDNLKAINFKYNYLQQQGIDSLFNADHMSVLENHLNSFVDSLQNEYSESIYINLNEFNKISLSRIQMSATYSNAAYKSIVPSFPILTTSFSIDYGNILVE